MKALNTYLLLIITICSAAIASAAVTRYEAEDMSAYPYCDSIIWDASANDSVRVAFVDCHSEGFMMLGPTDSFPEGHYIATFRMKRGIGVNEELEHPINPACILSITSNDTLEPAMEYRARQPLYYSSFDTTNQWKSFRVGFYLPQKVYYVQFRIKWFDSVDVYSDYVDLNDGPDTSKTVYAINLQDPDAMLGLPHDSSPFNYEVNKDLPQRLAGRFRR